MADKTLPYDPSKPVQIVQVNGDAVVVAPITDPLVPGDDYYVEVIVRPSGPGAAGCTGHATCGSMNL
jgi:hypothetical protein